MVLTHGKKLAMIMIPLAALAILASCSTAPSGPGPSAQQAELNYRMTATAEIAATATQVQSDANARIAAAYMRSTQQANGEIQATRTAQEIAMDDAVIANLQIRATSQKQEAVAQATENTAKATETAYLRTATAVAIQDGQARMESSSRFINWTLLTLFVVGAIFGFGSMLLIFWRYYTKHSFIPNQAGTGGVVVEASPFDPLRHLLGQPSRSPNKFSLLLPAGPDMPSADPDKPYVPMLVNNLGRKTVYNANEKTLREQQWDIFRLQTMVNFATVSYEYARKYGKVDGTKIERWKTLADFAPDRAYINSRWWSDITDVLEAAGVIKPKEAGKETNLLETGPCKNISDLVILAGRDRLLPIPPPVWFQLEEVSQPRNSDGSGTVEQSEQSEQSLHQAYVNPGWQPGPDDAIWNIPEAKK
jgi:hypothetical protein